MGDRADKFSGARLLLVRSPLILILACAIVGAFPRLGVQAQSQGNATAVPRGPRATLSKVSTLFLTGRVDSNSPAIWDLAGGRDLLHVFTSFNGMPSLAVGTDVQRLGTARSVTLSGFEGGGYWLEAVVKDVDGTLYGYYHNERPATFCAGPTKMIPRIGAARSTDQGRTWENLGTLVEAPLGTFDCTTPNRYFVGGVGDLSVMLDPDSTDLYIFYSEYLRAVTGQGVGVARLLWADRDEPSGKVTVWRDDVWQPARRLRMMGGDGTTVIRFVYPVATPLYPTTESWHDDDTETDAFWGPSVHWNTYLQQYVMLLNRAKNSQFDQEGIYVSFAPTLDDPSSWSAPEKILSGGAWYPQVFGLESGLGTDKVAGEKARLFMAGRSDYTIQFSK
jgi:hypothetical protein